MFFLKILWGYLMIVVVLCRDPPTVKIPEQGTIMGMFMKMYRTQRLVAYMGIPYAQPPIGMLRFQAPDTENLPSWEPNVRNGSIMQADCYQNVNIPKPKHSVVFDKLINKAVDMDSMEISADQYDEDCLYLNIFVPDAPAPPDGFAVIVWLHSGDFSSGSPFELNPFQLVFKQKVIVATVAFRLNIMGFFTTMDRESPGNYGLHDQSAALMWLKKNIKLFGGNEETMTLMGHGAGAASASLHLTSKERSEGLFSKAIIMSGSSLVDTVVRTPSYYTKAIDRTAHEFACYRTPTTQLIDCLRRVAAKILVETAPDQHWGPIVDEGLTKTPFISDAPHILIERGFLRSVPIMIGFTDMEEAFDLMAEDMIESGISHELYDSMLSEIVVSDFAKYESNESMCPGNNQIAMEAVNFLYQPYPPTTDKLMLRKFYLDFINDRKYLAPTILMAAHMSKQSDTYVYRFDIKPRTMLDLPEFIGVPHGFEQIFIWGLPYWGTQSGIQWDNADKRVADIIMTMWANFAKHTNPTQVGVYIRWETFTHENPSILIIDRSFNMSDFQSLNYRAIQFWNDYYPSVLNFAAGCCNMTDSSSNTQFTERSFTLAFFLITMQLLIVTCTYNAL